MTTLTPLATEPDDAVQSVEDGRARLDAIDAQLMELVIQRRAVSTQVQQLRIADGGSRVEHSRENAIIRRYAEGLGDAGADLALAVLAHCRGRR
jgi:chorismate mutase